MSFPSIPQITPTISLNRSQVVNLLLASVALEEMGLAHIINVEGEKLQAVLHTLHRKCGSIHHPNLIEINREVRRTLQTVLKSQILLQSKLEDILEITPKACHCRPKNHYPHAHSQNHTCSPSCQPIQHYHGHNHNYFENSKLTHNKYYYSSACKSCKFYYKCNKNRKHW